MQITSFLDWSKGKFLFFVHTQTHQVYPDQTAPWEMSDQGILYLQKNPQKRVTRYTDLCGNGIQDYKCAMVKLYHNCPIVCDVRVYYLSMLSCDILEHAYPPANIANCGDQFSLFIVKGLLTVILVSVCSFHLTS